MSNIFYWKLAGTNIKKNKKTYVPFMITCAATIMMFYMMCYLKGIDGLEQLQGSEAIIMIMQFGVIVIGVFAAIFLFYTNSFLMKRRKKEFGLYNILGMEKLHLARVIGLETLYVWAFTLLVGLGLGILFSKLMSLLLFKLLTFELPFGFSVSTEGLVNSLILFSGIFLMIFLNNIRQIHLAKPVELLSGGAVGEREPKVKWILTAVGLISLSVGYIIAITTKAPLEAIPLFFVAVILVIIGTYCLFIAGSIALLKLLKKNKKYYYQTKNFTAISGMLYRMKQNAVGLANICILSTMVLVMLSTTLSLYLGIEDALRIQNPRNISVEAFDLSLQERASLTEEIDALIQQKGVNKKDELNYISTMKMMQRDGEKITLTEKNVYNATNIEIGFFISQDEYNFMKNENLQLKENETRIYSLGEKFHEKEINLEGTRYVVGEEVLDLPVAPGYYASISDIYFFIMPNDAPVLKQQSLLYYGFDTDASAEEQIQLTEEIKAATSKAFGANVFGAESIKNSFYLVYGGLFFLGLFLGTLFIMATVLIMYYKQISEGYEDKQRFEIMQKVGMSKEEVKRAIGAQVITVFFLPLVVAGVHIAFAFNLITGCLAALNLTNISLFAWCTLGTLLVFAIFYGIVYALTAKTYYRIVQS